MNWKAIGILVLAFGVGWIAKVYAEGDIFPSGSELKLTWDEVTDWGDGVPGWYVIWMDGNNPPTTEIGTVSNSPGTQQSFTFDAGADGQKYVSVQAATTGFPASALAPSLPFVIGEVIPPPTPGGIQRFNFQPANAFPEPGYTIVDSSLYTQARGWGWDNAVDERNRGTSFPTLLDTFMATTNNNGSTWRLNIANGDYLVSLLLHDPSFSQGRQQVLVNNAYVVDANSLSQGEIIQVTDHPVTVSNGQLLVKIIATNGQHSIINWITVTPVTPSGPLPTPQSVRVEPRT